MFLTTNGTIGRSATRAAVAECRDVHAIVQSKESVLASVQVSSQDLVTWKSVWHRLNGLNGRPCHHALSHVVVASEPLNETVSTDRSATKAAISTIT